MLRGRLAQADEIVDLILDQIFAEMKLGSGDKVAVLVNSLGGTPLMELYILYRRVEQRLAAKGVEIDTELGRTLLHVDRHGRGVDFAPASRSRAARAPSSSLPNRILADGLRSAIASRRNPMAELLSHCLSRMFHNIADSIEEAKDHLSELDGAIGDADHGVTMSIGFQAVKTELSRRDLDAMAPDELMNLAAMAFLNSVGASTGPLYATGFRRAAQAIDGATADDTRRRRPR